MAVEKVLHIYFLQHLFKRSDAQAEDAIYDREAMRRFARVELGDEVMPDEATILRFRHLLETHRPGRASVPRRQWLWGFGEVRYRGIAKNLTRAFSLFALADLAKTRAGSVSRGLGAAMARPTPGLPSPDS